MLMLGCCTRFAAAIQIPSLAGAVFMLHWREGLMTSNQSLEFAALVLVMLIVFVLCGPGPLSVDRAMARPPQHEPRPLQETLTKDEASEAEQFALEEDSGLPRTAAGEAWQGLPAKEEEDDKTPIARRFKLRIAYVMAIAAAFVILTGLQHFALATAVLLTGAITFGVWVTGRPSFE
jgi:hypothetical protein